MNYARFIGVAATVAVTLSSATPAFAHGARSGVEANRPESHQSPASQRDVQNMDNGGTTTVVLNQALVPALVGLGVAPVRPGTLTAPGGTYQVAFPITGVESGLVAHAGGLDFANAAAGDVKITRFIVDTNAGVLTARASVNGARAGRIPVFTLGPVQEVSAGVTPSCAGIAAGLSLTPQAGAALGVPAKTFIGDACVVPAPGDDSQD